MNEAKPKEVDHMWNAVRVADAHNITSIAQARDYLLDDRSHGDEYAADAVAVVDNILEIFRNNRFQHIKHIQYIAAVEAEAMRARLADGNA